MGVSWGGVEGVVRGLEDGGVGKRGVERMDGSKEDGYG